MNTDMLFFTLRDRVFEMKEQFVIKYKRAPSVLFLSDEDWLVLLRASPSALGEQLYYELLTKGEVDMLFGLHAHRASMYAGTMTPPTKITSIATLRGSSAACGFDFLLFTEHGSQAEPERMEP